MTRALLIDGGQSGCRAAVVDHGRTLATTALPGLPRQGRDYAVLRALLAGDVEARGGEAGRGETRAGEARGGDDVVAAPAWLDAVAGGVDVVAAGLTGFAGEVDAVAAAVPAPTVLVAPDVVTAHLGALGGEPGVVAVAGTGAIALAVGADGRTARADGWGTRLGDDGGGYWIGRAGMAAALRAHDGRRGGSPDLLERALARFGGPRGIIAAVYDAPDPVAVIAPFARDVADAARDGDERARAIWDEAGRELARTTVAARDRLGIDGPVSYAGGLFAAGDLLLEPFAVELGGEVRAPLGDALDGAARLLERPPHFLDLIHETGAP